MPGNTPIAVFAFNRLRPLVQTLAALERTKSFPTGPVYLFCDAAREYVSGEDRKVTEVRDYLTHWSRKHEATCRFADSNQGLRRSIVGGVSQLLEDYEQVIVLEDDLIASPYLLEYLQTALNCYSDNEQVIQVSGYNVPHNSPMPDVGFLAVPACWGWATWRRAWRGYCDDANYLWEQIQQNDLLAFDIDGTYDYSGALQRNAIGTQNTWHVRWYASTFAFRGLTVYPRVSMTRNIGFGEDGTNCTDATMAKLFGRQRIADSHIEFASASDTIRETPEYRRALCDFYRRQAKLWSTPKFSVRCKNRVLSLLRKIGVRS